MRARSHNGVFFTIYMRRQPRLNEAEGEEKHARLVGVKAPAAAERSLIFFKNLVILLSP